MPTKSPSQLIQQVLVAFDLNVKELAEMMGVASKSINRWLQERARPQHGSLLKLASTFGCSTIEELERRVDRELKVREFEQASEVSGVRLDSLKGVQRDVYLIRFLEDPGSERKRILTDYPALLERSKELWRSHQKTMESAATLLESVIRLEERLR